MSTTDLIINFSLSSIGFKEIKDNQGFINPWFDKMMRERGFEDGDAWCALFAEFIWYEVYHSTPYEKLINKLFSKSAVETYYNFKIDGTFEIGHIAKPGAIVCWRYFKDGEKTWQGHVGIVVPEITKDNFNSVEGNGNSFGGREGIEVVKKVRNYKIPDNGLRLLGFIYPINIEP